MREIPEFPPDATLCEREIVIKFYLNRSVQVLLFQDPDESFSDAMDRTAKKTMNIMRKYKLYDLAESGEEVISNMQFDPEYDWVYSIRVHKRED